MAGHFAQKRLQLPVNSDGFVCLGKVGHQGDAGHPGKASRPCDDGGVISKRKSQPMHAAVEFQKDLNGSRGRLLLQPVEMRGVMQYRPQIEFDAGGDFIRAEESLEQQDGLLHAHLPQIGGFFKCQHGKTVGRRQRASRTR